MKNLKKLMSVVLTVAMLMSFAVSTSAAQFADVDETNSAYEAIEVLADLKILEGKDANNFDPDANIKRSEFAAVICRALNAEAAASGSTGVKFNDVAADHWAAGYINWAADSKIVNGRGNGNFDPDANVTYQEAVKMIVAAMGFGPLAEKRGGYPTGYMAIANTYSIPSGVAMSPATAPADRKGVAKLVYNAFDAPLMDASYITLNNDDEYKIYDGSKSADYERRTILSYYHDIYKFKANVDETYRSTDSLRKSNGDKYINMEITNLYKFDKDDIKNEFTVPSGFFGDAADKDTNTMKVLVNDTSYAQYIGYTVNAYVKYNDDGENEAVAIVPDVNSVDVIEITNPRTLISESSVSGQTVTFEYWEDENASKTTTAKFVEWDDVQVYRNGVAINFDASEFATLNDGSYNTVTLLGTKSEGKYNKIMLNEYQYGIIDRIDADEKIVTCTSNDEFSFNMDDHDDEFSYTIYKDGAIIDFADLKEGDMLNVITDADEGSFDEATFADIYVSSDALEASVEEIVPDGKGTNKYKIGGTEYYKTGNQFSSLRAGDTGLFYITIDGYLYDVDLTKSTSGNYAFILDVAQNTSGFGDTWQIKLLGKDNNTVTLDVKDNAKITSNFDYDAETFTGKYDKVSTKKNDDKQNKLFGVIENYVDATDSDLLAGLQYRMITYKTNGSEISDITLAKAGSDDKEFNITALRANSEYNANSDRLGGYSLLDSTVIFNAPVKLDASKGTYSLNQDKVQVYSISSLDEDQKYEGFVLDQDSDKAIGAALLSSDMGFAGKQNALAVVQSVSTGLDASGDTADVINFFQAGEKKSLAITNTGYIGEKTASDLAAGYVFQYTTNAAGEINDMDIVATVDYSDNKFEIALQKTADGDKISYVVGVVTDIGSKFVNIVNADGAVDNLGWGLDNDATNVLFDVAKAKSNVSNAFKAYTSNSYIKANDSEDGKFTTDGYVIVAKADSDDITEVVTYKLSKTGTYNGATLKGATIATIADKLTK